MALKPGKPINDITIDKVFIGSCTNSRIEDMREAAAVVKKLGAVAANVKLALVVPGSGLVKEQAEREGLQDLQGRRLRVARARLLHVPGHECRPSGARRALRLHQQPQLRRPPGRWRPHPPREPAGRRCGRARHWTSAHSPDRFHPPPKEQDMRKTATLIALAGLCAGRLQHRQGRGAGHRTRGQRHRRAANK
jgi:hypothetical protein